MNLSELRDQIDGIDKQIVGLLGRRLEIAKEIARIKKREQLSIFDPQREKAMMAKIRILAKAQGLSVAIVEELFQLVLDYSKLEMEMVQ